MKLWVELESSSAWRVAAPAKMWIFMVSLARTPAIARREMRGSSSRQVVSSVSPSSFASARSSRKSRGQTLLWPQLNLSLQFAVVAEAEPAAFLHHHLGEFLDYGDGYGHSRGAAGAASCSRSSSFLARLMAPARD